MVTRLYKCRGIWLVPPSSSSTKTRTKPSKLGGGVGPLLLASLAVHIHIGGSTFPIDTPSQTLIRLQEVFHVYLNKFENAVTNLFLVICGDNWILSVSLISRNTQPSRKQFLIFIFWFETVSEDEQSNFKRLKMLSETKCTKSFSNNFSKIYDVFLLKPFIYCT